MAVICNKFDARIKDFSDIQSFKQYDDKYIGKLGYFSDSFCAFQDLDECLKTTLSDITDDIKDNEETSDYIFVAEDCGNYRFFLPEELLKEPEKKYRAFSLNEFSELYAIGDVVTFRLKDCEVTEQSMLIGFQSSDDEDIPGNGYVLIGNCKYGFMELFNNYELKYLNQWQPFGIEE